MRLVVEIFPGANFSFNIRFAEMQLMSYVPRVRGLQIEWAEQ